MILRSGYKDPFNNDMPIYISSLAIQYGFIGKDKAARISNEVVVHFGENKPRSSFTVIPIDTTSTLLYLMYKGLEFGDQFCRKRSTRLPVDEPSSGHQNERK